MNVEDVIWKDKNLDQKGGSNTIKGWNRKNQKKTLSCDRS